MSVITKYDIRLGNMFEQGIVWKISGRTGAKVHLHGKGKWYKGFRTEVDVKELKPILLTPKVLTEWCGFWNVSNTGFQEYVLGQIYIYSDGDNFWFSPIEGKNVILNGIHELQNLYKATTNTELEIKG